jgi:hypothetical protein
VFIHEMLDLGTDAAAATRDIYAKDSWLTKAKALPWSKLCIPLVVFQIVTQFVNVTGLQLPSAYTGTY